MYHRENDQEDFLVLAGRGAGDRRGRGAPAPPVGLRGIALRGPSHVIVGAGAGPCVILGVGARDRSTGPDWGAYIVDETAQRHGAGVERETTDAREAYAPFSQEHANEVSRGLAARLGMGGKVSRD